MPCPHCQSASTTEQEGRTTHGYRRFRCRACERRFNERTGTVLNRIQVPSDLASITTTGPEEDPQAVGLSGRTVDRIWAAARDLYRTLLPLLMFETGYGTAVYKEVLRRRGVIACAAIRQPGGKTLDRYAMADLTAILEDLAPEMNDAYPARLAA